MKTKAITYILCLYAAYGCSHRLSTSITVLSEKDAKGNYTLKWEIFPDQDNIPVEIYASDNDSIFPSNPILIAKSDDYIAIINKADSLGLKFFQLKIGGVLSNVVTNRFFELDSIQNFRDIGGYRTNDNRIVKWGKIFRSGDFSHITEKDIKEIDKLGLKSIIDLRSKRSISKRPDKLLLKRRYEIPISQNIPDSISRKIIDGQFLRGDAIIYTQDWYKSMIENYSEAFAQLFDLLADKSNYPLIYHCSLGKDQSGLVTYFLLRALDVPIDTIEEDYIYSEYGINKAKIVQGVEDLSESRQEAFTMMTKTDPAFLKYAISCIRHKSGSIEEYMKNDLRITPEKKQKLKQILLYNQQ